MSNIKRTAIVIVALVLIAVVMVSFKGSDVLDRAIILGIGIDKGDSGVTLTAEIVSPGNGQEQVGTFSKTVTVDGATVGEAIQNIAEKTGKEASLGQCVVLILGQELYETVDFTAITDYFINHHSFKESAVMCCCEGKAEELFNNSDALSQSVALSVAAMLLDEADKIGIMSNSLLQFARSQTELEKTGFLNKIKFTPSENKDAQDPDKTQGFFSYRELAVFRQNTFVCDLNEDEVKGLSMFLKDTEGETFVSDSSGLKLTVQVNSKDIEQKINGDEVDISITLSVRLARTDSDEVTGAITAKKDKEIDGKMLDDVQKQATELAELYLKKQAEYNFDLIKLHEMSRQKNGSSRELAEKPTSDFIVKLKIEVKEN
ncbi:MAG: hypothetical protein J1F66_03270 [Clostridiales bacterium]|nr:hypothetical protein [Clostridiales bacterium]